jgi:glycosyltransferase involved in cell wall biosynthesis
MTRPILYVHHRAEMSGAARSLAALIANLDDVWEPHVLTPAGAVVDLFKDAGARVTTAPVALFQHTWDNPYAGRKWALLGREAAALGPHVAGLERTLRGTRFSLVHLNDSPLLAAAAVAKRHGLPVVWHLRSALSQRGRLRPAVVRRSLNRWGDAAIAIDDDVAASFALDLPTTTVFNGVAIPSALDGRAAAKEQLGLPDRTIVGFIGNLRRVKGWPQFVEAAALLRDEPLHFVVLGKGVRTAEFFSRPYGRLVSAAGLAADEEAEMRAAVSAAGLDAQFTFLPFTDDVGAVYRALDVVAFPNQGAGLGRPVLEAAAFGVPSVASGSPSGAGVLIPDETGILLPSGAGEPLAAALSRLGRDVELRSRLGLAAAEHARLHFDAGRNRAAVEAVYAQVGR